MFHLLADCLQSAKKPFFTLSLAVLLSALTGCSFTKQSHSGYGQTPLAELNHWQVKARVAIRTPEESVSASLDWQKQAQNFDFHIFGMFGATYAHLTQAGHQATLLLPEDQTYYHQDAEQLLYQALGWDFPLDALSYWIKGLPSGKSGEAITRNDKQELSKILFKDWKVTFSRYGEYAGYQMPSRITAEHPQLRLKVVVKDWSFLPEQIQ